MHVIPLHWTRWPIEPGGVPVVGGLDFDAAIEVHRSFARSPYR